MNGLHSSDDVIVDVAGEAVGVVREPVPVRACFQLLPDTVGGGGVFHQEFHELFEGWLSGGVGPRGHAVVFDDVPA